MAIYDRKKKNGKLDFPVFQRDESNNQIHVTGLVNFSSEAALSAGA
jgi:hypothetical protein